MEGFNYHREEWLLHLVDVREINIEDMLSGWFLNFILDGDLEN